MMIVIFVGKRYFKFILMKWSKKLLVCISPWILVMFFYKSPLIYTEGYKLGLKPFLIPFIIYLFSLAVYVFTLNFLPLVEKIIVTIIFSIFNFILILMEYNLVRKELIPEVLPEEYVH